MTNLHNVEEIFRGEKREVFRGERREIFGGEREDWMTKTGQKIMGRTDKEW